MSNAAFRVVHGDKELAEKLGRNDRALAGPVAASKHCCLASGHFDGANHCLARAPARLPTPMRAAARWGPRGSPRAPLTRRLGRGPQPAPAQPTRRQLLFAVIAARRSERRPGRAVPLVPARRDSPRRRPTCAHRLHNPGSDRRTPGTRSRSLGSLRG